MKFTFVTLLVLWASLVSAQTIQLNLKTMTYHDAFEFAATQLADGRGLTPTDLAQLSLMAKKLRDDGDTSLARKTELLIASDRLQVSRALELRNPNIAEVWSAEKKLQVQNQTHELLTAVRNWSLGLSLASAAGTFFFLWQANYASTQPSTPYYQRLGDNSKFGVGMCLYAFGVFFLSLFDAQNQL